MSCELSSNCRLKMTSKGLNLRDLTSSQKPSNDKTPAKGRQPAGTAKLPVAEPTSLGKFAVILTMHACKKVLLIDTRTRLFAYLCVLTVISVVTDFMPFPATYFSNKRNVLNQYFVKIGWGWTSTLLTIFVFLTSRTYCAGNVKSVYRHLSRLVFATFWWWACTRFFDYIHSTVGACTGSPTDISSWRRDACETAGHRWLGFDVSGHAFLLIHCLLTISEEVKCIIGWERIDEMAAQEQQNPTDRYTQEDLEQIRSLYKTCTPYVRLLIVALTLLTILWEMMLLATVVYFHNLPQKIGGAAFAAVGWFISYRVWYSPRVMARTEWTPGLPGRGLFKYMKDSS